ncbi:hypothetical protein [Amycolatopsis sp. Hca4]|uniref:hypothetical protein n=1 Tax=unclassified Amycolatopsis TaxID=2618356 RepID=UPI000CA152C1|nr:hypothetical protein [Amycolatopsis sp. Hca4]ATV95631.1 hypothetical protein [Amycolatopsis sp.]QKV75119.1 hypothetical protein HUT10_16120 [Amycolatopsis sp. Hca4]
MTVPQIRNDRELIEEALGVPAPRTALEAVPVAPAEAPVQREYLADTIILGYN